jgi:hypothetical protein
MRICKSQKDKQCNDQRKKDKRDLQNTVQKTKYGAIPSPVNQLSGGAHNVIGKKLSKQYPLEPMF